MAVAVVTTLLLDGIGNWGLIALGLGIGTAVGVVASIRVQMTEMPQMVALYNGVGGGAVALIAWSEIRHGISARRATIPLDDADPDPLRRGRRLGLLLGLEHRLRQAPGPDPDPAARGAGPAGDQRAAAGRHPRRLRRHRGQQRRSLAGALHRGPDRRGAARQPRRAADRRRRHAGRDLAAQRLHRPLRRGRRLRARQRRPDRRRHPGRLLGNDPDDGDGDGDEPLGRQRPLRRLRRRARGRRRRQHARSARTPRSAPRTRRSSSPTPTRS